VDPLVLELTGKKTPQTGLEGKFSVYHSCAAAIIYGAAGENEYGDAIVRDARIITLRDKVEAVAKDDINEDEVYVTITLNDGRVLKKHVEHAIGSIEKPMSREQLVAKFDSLARDVLPVERADALREMCWKMEDLADAGDLARAAAL
jgi:2-methylcitrate dehydratase PrpD